MANEVLSAILTDSEVGNPGCGVGTDTPCFALTQGGKEASWQCMGVLIQQDPAEWAYMFNMTGIQLGWRANVDQSDDLAWCAKGVLGNSKKPPVPEQGSDIVVIAP